jgi:hypothetical protein
MGPDDGGGGIIGDQALVVAEELDPMLAGRACPHTGAGYPVGHADQAGRHRAVIFRDTTMKDPPLTDASGCAPSKTRQKL